MEHLIRHKSLTENLSKNDIKQMVISLIDQEDGASDVMSAFWSHAYLQYKQNDARFVHKINDVASKLALNQQNNDENTGKRSDDDDQHLQQPSRQNINAIPNALVNKIGTFLHFSDLFRMECANRKFFVSLRFPFPAIQSIPCKGFGREGWITAYITYCEKTGLPINFDRFRGMKTLTIYGSEIGKYASLFGKTFASISDVCLENLNMDKLYQAMQLVFDPEAITRLYVCVDATDADPLQFQNILCQLKNVQILQIDVDGTPFTNRFDSDIEAMMSGVGCEFLPSLIYYYSYLMSARANKSILDAAASELQAFAPYSPDETFYSDMEEKNLPWLIIFGSSLRFDRLICLSAQDKIRYSI